MWKWRPPAGGEGSDTGSCWTDGKSDRARPCQEREIVEGGRPPFPHFGLLFLFSPTFLGVPAECSGWLKTALEKRAGRNMNPVLGFFERKIMLLE